MRISCTIDTWKGIDMAHKYTEEELNELGQKAVIALFLSMQDQMERMNENMDALIEQIRISNQRQFGRKTEQLEVTRITHFWYSCASWFSSVIISFVV